MEVKNRLAQDVRKLTFAASRLRIHKRKDKVAQKTAEKNVKDSFNTPPSSEKKVEDPAPVDTTRTSVPETTTQVSQPSTKSSSVGSAVSRPPPLPSKGIRQHTVGW